MIEARTPEEHPLETLIAFELVFEAEFVVGVLEISRT